MGENVTSTRSFSSSPHRLYPLHPLHPTPSLHLLHCSASELSRSRLRRGSTVGAGGAVDGLLTSKVKARSGNNVPSPTSPHSNTPPTSPPPPPFELLRPDVDATPASISVAAEPTQARHPIPCSAPPSSVRARGDWARHAPSSACAVAAQAPCNGPRSAPAPHRSHHLITRLPAHPPALIG